MKRVTSKLTVMYGVNNQKDEFPFVVAMESHAFGIHLSHTVKHVT